MDSIDPLLLDFFGAAIFCKVVQFLEDCRLFIHVGGELTQSLSVVDLWFLVGGNNGVDKRLVDLFGPSDDNGVDGWGSVERREIFFHGGPKPVHYRLSVIIGGREIIVLFVFCDERGDFGNRS